MNRKTISEMLIRQVKILLVFALLVLFGTEVWGQTQHPDWTANSPEKYDLKVIVPGIGTLDCYVKIQYYLKKGNTLYYRKSVRSNRKFGKDFGISEKHTFVARVAFEITHEGYDKSDLLQLKINNHEWISANGCFIDNEDKYKDGLTANNNGHVDIVFGLKPDCEQDSDIKIDFKIINKNGEGLKFKIDGKKVSKKSTGVTIPIKVGLSKEKQDDADKVWLKGVLNGLEKEDLNEQIRFLKEDIYKPIKDGSRKALIKKEITQRVDTYYNQNFIKVNPCGKNPITVFEKTDNYKNFLSSNYKQEFVKIKKECEDAATSEADQKWFGKILVSINKKSDKNEQIEDLITLFKTKDLPDSRKALVDRKIRIKVEDFFTETVLKADPKINWVKDFENEKAFTYLSDSDKEKYEKHINTGKDQEKQREDDEAFKKATIINTIDAYQKYIREFPDGFNKTKANIQIRTLRNTDELAWDTALKKEGDTRDPCIKATAFEEYLNNSKHHIKYRPEAKTQKEEHSANCNTFRIERKTEDEDVAIGHYILNIKKGTPPYKVTIKDASITWSLEDDKISLSVIEGGEYEIITEDSADPKNQTKYLLVAENPDFSILLDKEKITARGGVPPFEFVTDDQAQNNYKLKDARTITKDKLTKELGMENANFSFIASDYNETKSGPHKMSDISTGEDPLIPLWATIAIFALIAFLFREKWIPLFKRIFKMPTKEDKIWQRAEEKKTQEYYMLYKEKYPDGKYTTQIQAKIEDIQFWEKCLNEKNFGEYLKNYKDKDGMFFMKAFEANKETNYWHASKTNKQYKNYLDRYSDGLYSKEAKNLLEKKDIAARKNADEPQKADIDIDFIAEEGDTITIEEVETTEPLTLPPNDYFKFELNKHWSDSTVSTVWMSKDACKKAYLLIEQAVMEIIRKDEEIVVPEVGAFLLGTPHKISEGNYEVRIEKFISVTPENNGEYEISFGRKAFHELDDANQANPDLILVGWMHTHPGHGLFLSGKDQEVVNTWFKEPYHISMEVETKTKHLDTAFFTRKQDESLNNHERSRIAEEWFHWADVKLWVTK